jgi:hypothetical protein
MERSNITNNIPLSKFHAEQNPVAVQELLDYADL